MTFHVTAMKSGECKTNQELEPDIHQLLAIAQEIRPISLRTLYRWLDITQIGAGRTNYSESEVEQIKVYASQAKRNQNIQKLFNKAQKC